MNPYLVLAIGLGFVSWAVRGLLSDDIDSLGRDKKPLTGNEKPGTVASVNTNSVPHAPDQHQNATIDHPGRAGSGADNVGIEETPATPIDEDS